MPRLPPAPDVEWRDGALVSRAHDDIYFSRAGGLAETRAVFHAGCGLPQAWAGRDRFTIVELGFGTGLNALATWDAWAAARAAGAILHMVSVESHLLDRADAARALAAFPEVEARAARLLSAWPVRAAAAQRFWAPEDGFALTVLVGEAGAALAGLEARVDAWFLDGFAPARNPDMWTDAIFARMAALSAPDARVATYSVSGAVRAGLTAAGFAVEKKPGFAGKRERLEGRLVTPTARTYPLLPRGAGVPPKRVVIVGGGIGGAAAAAAFVRRGVQTTILERAPALATAASGNPVGLVMPRLDRADTPIARLYRTAHLAALSTYRPMGRDVFLASDLLEKAESEEDVAAFADLGADPPLPPDLLTPVPHGLVHHAGLVMPAAAAALLATGAEVRCGVEVTGIDPGPDEWRVTLGDGGIIAADAVVVAAGARLAGFADLPIALRAGQLEWAADVEVDGPALSSGTYAAPFDGGLMFGATFDAIDTPDAAVSEDARARNRAALEKLAPDWSAVVGDRPLLSRAAVRATTPDRAPIAGLALDEAAWRARCAGLAHGRAVDLSTPTPGLQGLYLLGGLGSRGLSLAPLVGEVIASEACGEPQMLDAATLDAIHPGRFTLRALKRGQLT